MQGEVLGSGKKKKIPLQTVVVVNVLKASLRLREGTKTRTLLREPLFVGQVRANGRMPAPLASAEARIQHLSTFKKGFWGLLGWTEWTERSGVGHTSKSEAQETVEQEPGCCISPNPLSQNFSTTLRTEASVLNLPKTHLL